MGTYSDLIVYQKAFKNAMDIFGMTKTFPKEERYSLIDQVRRSSRSVCANFGEAYRRREYINHFKSKLADCDAENTETEIWIKFSAACEYIDSVQESIILGSIQEVGKMIGAMLKEPEKYLAKIT